MGYIIAMNIDALITSYDIREDKILSKNWRKISQKIWARIESYGKGVNNYGPDTLAPHLTRIAEDSRDFLLYLGHPEHVAHNFYDAIKISDLGKTHEEFDVTIWKLPQKPSKRERSEKRLHTQRGLNVLHRFLEDAPQELLDHPHIKAVLPAHIQGHHKPLTDDPNMGKMMEIACLVDAYDGDMDTKKIRHGAGSTRTVQDQYIRMLGNDDTDKYKGYFRKELLDSYFEFRNKYRASIL